ncbi:hypothetical protein LF844_09685 [Metapseudomonas lalkuanensis]|uniref:hypothetical protein n=1 Tax=Metapseudomonas lalkuanensis TaxID=2604832 RepID=UPI001CF214BA|nr:hypothetical protein [Pseudomonas lalkuanensis]UCP00060.1 hypothetical protein LF844_09685 [Pseudomonas lalkuanensis]
MLRGFEDSERLTEFYAYIQDGEVREAFALLIGTFACLQSVTCRVVKQGSVRSVGIYQGEKWMFSVMPTQQRLHFQWRPPAIASSKYDKASIAAAFPDFSDHKQEEHWSVYVCSIESALLLLLILDLQ